MSAIPQLNNNNKGINHRESWCCCHICCEQGRTKRAWFSKARTRGYIQCRQYKLEKLWGPHTFVSAQTIEKGLWIGNGLPSWSLWQPERPAPAQNGVATSCQPDSVGAEHWGKDTHTHYTRLACAHTSNLGSQLAPTCHDYYLGLVFGCSAAICTCRANAERGKNYLL